MNALICAIHKIGFNQISTCEIAHDIWRTLEVIHEGTSQVKQTKINMLVQIYELFKIQSYESIDEMSTRFNDSNTLKYLGNVFSQEDLVRKILRSLTPK